MGDHTRVEWVKGVELHEAAEALGIATAEIMAVHSDGRALFTTETETAEDPPIWRAQLRRDADGILVAGPWESIGTVADFHAAMRRLMDDARKVGEE